MRFLFLILVVTPVLGTEFYNRERRQAQQSNYRAYNNAPAAIKQILAAQQARDPIVHLPPQPVPNLSSSGPAKPQYVNQADLVNYRPQVQIGQPPPQPTYKQIPVKSARYNPPQGAASPPQPQPVNPQYRANYAPAPQAQPHLQQAAAQPNYQYSRNLPPHLQQILQVQHNLGNAIPQGQRQG